MKTYSGLTIEQWRAIYGRFLANRGIASQELCEQLAAEYYRSSPAGVAQSLYLIKGTRGVSGTWWDKLTERERAYIRHEVSTLEDAPPAPVQPELPVDDDDAAIDQGYLLAAIVHEMRAMTEAVERMLAFQNSVWQ